MELPANMERMQNPAVILYGPGKAGIEETPIPSLLPAVDVRAPSGENEADGADSAIVPSTLSTSASTDPNDVLLRISYVGVCGSDVHFWVNGGVGDKLVQNTSPVIMGHEAVGVVHSVRSGSRTTLKPGDRVAIEPGQPCRSCRQCKYGYYNLCSSMRFAACPALAGEKEGTPGCLTKFFRVPADFCFKLPDHVSLEAGVLVEPLAVALHSVRQGHVAPLAERRNRVIVFGAGTIGLLSAAAARIYGATQVIIVDINKDRLDFARNEFMPQACETFRPDLTHNAEQNAQRLIAEHNLDPADDDMGPGADVVIECSGAEISVMTGALVLRMGGTMVQTAMGKPVVQFPIVELCWKEISLRGCFRYSAGDFDMAVHLLNHNMVPVDKLISGVWDFEKASDAWEATRHGKGIKNLIRGLPD